jgi:hypothetical protein
MIIRIIIILHHVVYGMLVLSGTITVSKSDLSFLLFELGPKNVVLRCATGSAEPLGVFRRMIPVAHDC